MNTPHTLTPGGRGEPASIAQTGDPVRQGFSRRGGVANPGRHDQDGVPLGSKEPALPVKSVVKWGLFANHWRDQTQPGARS